MQEFHLLNLIEKETFSEQNMIELQKVDSFFACLDAYLSILQATEAFGLVEPGYGADSDSELLLAPKVVNMLLKFKLER